MNNKASDKNDIHCQTPVSGYFVPLPQAVEGDEIDLLELWQVVWKRRWMILSVTFLVAVIAAGITLLKPNYYRAEVLLAPVSEEAAKGSLSSALGGLGGLASMAGISLGSSGSTEEHLAVLKSKEFIWKFVEDNNLMPILFQNEWDANKKRWIDKQPSLWDVYRLFTRLVSTSTNKNSGLVTIAVEWIDAGMASQWANQLVIRLNDYLRTQAIERSKNNLTYLNEELNQSRVADMRQVLYELIAKEQKTTMLANTQKEFAFRVIDPAVEPDKKSKPNRALITILAAVMGMMFAIFLAFLQEFLRKQKRDKNVSQLDG